MTPTVHYFEPRQWNSPDGPPPDGWFIVDDDYPLHIYPILAGPFATPEEADRELARLRRLDAAYADAMDRLGGL